VSYICITWRLLILQRHGILNYSSLIYVLRYLRYYLRFYLLFTRRSFLALTCYNKSAQKVQYRVCAKFDRGSWRIIPETFVIVS